MTIALQLEPPERHLPAVDYRWEPETEILSARLRLTVPERGAAGGDETLEVSGADGSWLMLDVEARQLRGVEVAVWPELSTRAGLRPPQPLPAARARVLAVDAARPTAPVPISAESDEPASTLHFRVGRARVASTVRLGGDLLLELDAHSRLAGLWLLNVPPAPFHQ